MRRGESAPSRKPGIKPGNGPLPILKIESDSSCALCLQSTENTFAKHYPYPISPIMAHQLYQKCVVASKGRNHIDQRSGEENNFFFASAICPIKSSLLFGPFLLSIVMELFCALFFTIFLSQIREKWQADFFYCSSCPLLDRTNSGKRDGFRIRTRFPTTVAN